MKKPVVRVMRGEVEAKCTKVTCLKCNGERILIGYAFIFPFAIACPSCKGKGTVRKFIGSDK